GQRLVAQRRNRLIVPGEPHVGNVLYQGALRGGARALGQNIGQLSVGYRADLVVLDSQNPFIASAEDQMLLNRWIFACSSNPITAVMTGGRWVIEDGHHHKEESVSQAFIQVMKDLAA
ncbi:amidohydrolase family protein, partial [Klebsiella pneumoniae]